jgi:hypothetical protein
VNKLNTLLEMRSKTAERIIEETPQETEERVQKWAE